ncbi:NADH oxidase [Herbiconiux sp. KACC 21604]|uniref:NADH oxidase n=1 Tax=unclassified Herbiconiux TaxID=2618217 RepID=UPI001490B919|nr:NADH oxidase [Herbiconiux sp. SALV-R1]QJU54776.1 NADH oxidase [Herbiconiux sp. SALV-R1]WPO85885.1 NADH oxidase [Herbiconiux sp. KACC 21604]
MTFRGRELRSTMTDDGRLSLTLEEVEIAAPGDDDLVLRVEAAPINPSDLGLLVGPADPSSVAVVPDSGPGLQLTVPQSRLHAMSARMGRSLPTGTEGAGTVVATGRNAADLLGRRVATGAGGMYADYRKVSVDSVTPLPDGATAAQGASMSVNPMAALGLVETARREGHRAIIHTVAASSLGLMLQRICRADGIPLVNIVRRPEQAEQLRASGAEHVVLSSADDFFEQLVDAAEKTGATIAFDPVGGGSLGGDTLAAMEQAALRRATGFSRYGSGVFKQLYVYGTLDLQPTVLHRRPNDYAWSVGGWHLYAFLATVGADAERRMRERVVAELTTTFATTYTRTVGLAEALRPEVFAAFERRATGEKFLIDPTRD